MSSCLSGGGRTYGFELDIMKSTSSSPSIRSSSHSSSPSSTLSDSSNAPITISTKRPRTPRKRPNQTYNEAAALLSSIYPNIFSTKSLRKLCQHPRPYDSFSEPPELLPGLPALSDAGFLIRNPPMMNSATHFEPKRVNSLKNMCQSPPSIDFHEPSSPGLIEDDDFDAESILDEEVEEGIDSIMGNLSMDNDKNDKSAGDSSNHNACINPYLGSLMGFGLGGRPEFGFGFRLHGRGIRRALRRTDDWDWWRSPTVAIHDIVPKFKKLSATEEKKKKKKKEINKEEQKDLEATSTKTTSTTTTTSSYQENLKPSLGLKLDYEDVLSVWSDRGCPYSDGPPESPESFARLAHIDLSTEAGGGSGAREAIVQRYKEKRRSRLFSKKIRYQVRKVNADRRPRMKASGRFVRKPSLLHEGTEEESQ